MNFKKLTHLLLSLICNLSTQILPAQSFGLQVKDSKITYSKDAKGNSILDFSYCGYKSSELDIPNVSNVIFCTKTRG